MDVFLDVVIQNYKYNGRSKSCKLSIAPVYAVPAKRCVAAFLFSIHLILVEHCRTFECESPLNAHGRQRMVRRRRQAQGIMVRSPEFLLLAT